MGPLGFRRRGRHEGSRLGDSSKMLQVPLVTLFLFQLARLWMATWVVAGWSARRCRGCPLGQRWFLNPLSGTARGSRRHQNRRAPESQSIFVAQDSTDHFINSVFLGLCVSNTSILYSRIDLAHYLRFFPVFFALFLRKCSCLVAANVIAFVYYLTHTHYTTHTHKVSSVNIKVMKFKPD